MSLGMTSRVDALKEAKIMHICTVFQQSCQAGEISSIRRRLVDIN